MKNMKFFSQDELVTLFLVGLKNLITRYKNLSDIQIKE